MYVSCVSKANHASEPLRCTIERQEGDQIEITIENISKRTLILLDWNIPSHTGMLLSDIFRVKDKHERRADYIGKYVTRSFSKKNCVRLKPRESYSTVVRLKEFYELRSNSEYRVKYDSFIQYSLSSNVSSVEDFDAIAQSESNVVLLNSLE